LALYPYIQLFAKLPAFSCRTVMPRLLIF